MWPRHRGGAISCITKRGRSYKAGGKCQIRYHFILVYHSPSIGICWYTFVHVDINHINIKHLRIPKLPQITLSCPPSGQECIFFFSKSINGTREPDPISIYTRCARSAFGEPPSSERAWQARPRSPGEWPPANPICEDPFAGALRNGRCASGSPPRSHYCHRDRAARPIQSALAAPSRRSAARVLRVILRRRSVHFYYPPFLNLHKSSWKQPIRETYSCHSPTAEVQ